MRQIVLDTETTGLDVDEGHRIIEIGCVLLNDRDIDSANKQWYINPKRDIDAGAQRIHGISNEFLLQKPVFTDIADEFIDFIKDSELIIHNAAFDVGFINAELKLLPGKGKKLEDYCQILDTLDLARKKHPGQKNSLDALCQRYGINLAKRELHGALLDAQLLAEVYLIMTSGQKALFADGSEDNPHVLEQAPQKIDLKGRTLTVIEPTADELAAHAAYLEQIDAKSARQCIWRKIEESN